MLRHIERVGSKLRQALILIVDLRDQARLLDLELQWQTGQHFVLHQSDSCRFVPGYPSLLRLQEHSYGCSCITYGLLQQLGNGLLNLR